MLVKYSPENADSAREWEFDPDRVRQSQAEIIEKRSGQSWPEWVRDVQAGSAGARRVLLWHLLAKDHHTLRLEDTPDFYMGEVEIDYSLSDLQKLRQQVADSSMDDASKASTLERLDLEMANRLGKEEIDVSDMGKAPSAADD